MIVEKPKHVSSQIQADYVPITVTLPRLGDELRLND